ncbi:hypothetical protein QTP88_024179 [Uroleucon formosanum]
MVYTLTKLLNRMLEAFAVTCTIIHTVDYHKNWIMVQDIVKTLGMKLKDIILGIKYTVILRFTFFVIMNVLAFQLECNKISKFSQSRKGDELPEKYWYQERLGYCRKFDNLKCENGGIRMYSNENGLSCWCTPDFFGEYCQTKKPVSFISRTVSMFRLGNSDDSRGRPTMWWSIFPFTSELQLKTIYAFHQSAVKKLENMFAGDNNDGYAARILPSACPLECCANDKTLPPLDTLYNNILKRKPGQFTPDRKNKNLLFDAFHQYFVLQFCGTNSNMTVTASQLYGNDAVSEKSMRSFSGGKLKTRKHNYKHYAMNDVFTLRSDAYLKASTNGILWLSRMVSQKSKRPDTLSTSTLLYVLSTVWVREHNRLCDELSQKWPSWTDQELYATARKIVTGQMMTIMMNEVMNVKLRPKVYHDQIKNINISGTPIELYLTMAVSNVREKLQYSSSSLTSFSNTRPFLEDGLGDALQFMVNSEMGMVTAHNEGALMEELTMKLMKLSRDQCLQGFNNYRRWLGLAAYNSFFDLTGNIETATELEKVYSTVENVEFVTGMFTEKYSSGVPPTIKVLSYSYIINSILTNHLTSKHSWVPDTFGGVEFFYLVKSTSLKSLVILSFMPAQIIHQSAVNRLENVFASDNNDGYGTRILPSSCPLECCANDKTLPPLDTLYNNILKRKPGQFTPDRKNNNLLLDAFYRYFVLQFWGTNSNLKVTASQLYGNDAVSERAMRSFFGGKLKTRKYNNKHYAKNDVFTLQSDVYLKASTNGILTGRSWLNRMIAQKSKQPETLSTNTMLYVLSTIWVREHNRVCEELSQKWPTWTDQELYATARKIVTGQMMTIMMNEVMNVELRPKVYDDQMKNIRVSGMPIELYLTMAVSNIPKILQYNSSNLTSFSKNRPYLENGLVDTLQFMVNSEMEMVTAHNEGALTEDLTKKLMTLTRDKCFQGFNNYRRRLGLAAYHSFFDLTGNIETATELEKLYSSVENVEFVTGVFAEKYSSGVLPTFKVLSNSYIITSILTNDLTSKHSWAPDTFGGVEFFDLVKSTTLNSLVCRNVGMTFEELQKCRRLTNSSQVPRVLSENLQHIEDHFYLIVLKIFRQNSRDLTRISDSPCSAEVPIDARHPDEAAVDDSIRDGLFLGSVAIRLVMGQGRIFHRGPSSERCIDHLAVIDCKVAALFYAICDSREGATAV